MRGGGRGAGGRTDGRTDGVEERRRKLQSDEDVSRWRGDGLRDGWGTDGQTSTFSTLYID